MNSSKNTASGTPATVTPGRAREFLYKLANLPDSPVEDIVDPAAGNAFRLKFMGLWPMPGERSRPNFQADIIRTPGAKSVDDQVDENLDYWLWQLRSELRVLWTTPDRRTRRWGIFRLVNDWVIGENRYLDDSYPGWQRPGSVAFLPPATAFETALDYLWRHRTAFCANPGCPARYFFPKRPGQKYCSSDCALPAQRQFKRNWWAEHGKRWRKKHSVSELMRYIERKSKAKTAAWRRNRKRGGRPRKARS